MKFFATVLPVLALALSAAAVSLTQVLDSVDLVTSTTKDYNAEFKRVSASNVGHEGTVRISPSPRPCDGRTLTTRRRASGRVSTV